MNENVIGKYYKRDDLEKDGMYLVYHVLRFDGRYYESEHYDLHIASSIKVNTLELQADFYKSPNFKEITKEEFEMVKRLYDNGGKFEYDNL